MAQTIPSHLLHGCVDLQRHLLPEAEEPGSFEEMTRALGIDSLESKTAKAQEKQFRSPDEFVRLANALLVERRTKNLLFTDIGAKTLRDHPISTTPRPDIIAYDPQQSPYPPYLWSSVEFVAKFRSKGRTMEQCRNRTKAHAVYLLQARPDLRFVIALLVEYDSLELYTCSHLGFKRYRPKDSAATLDAIVEYLASGQQAARDQFLTRTKDSASQSMGAFDLMECGGENKPCLDYRHLKTSHPLGCRTHIFVSPNLSGPPPLVIKDQYKKKNRHWAEMEILKHIHKDEFPGVVRVTFFNEYNKSPLDGYVKTRIGLEDHGSTFLDLRTPREVLYAIYDLLEITRRLFQDRQVLHRDISAFNFIIPSFERIGRSNKAPIGFIRHLLDTLHDPRAPPQGPFIILIDFDCAEIYDAKAPFFRQTGTPIFMARAVQFQGPLAEENWKPLDFQFIELDDVAAKIYQKFYPMRMEIFGNEKLTPGDSHKHIDSGFRHELRHDGESIVWVFLYWVMRAAPKGQPPQVINSYVWEFFHSKDAGDRHTLLDGFTRPGMASYLGRFIHKGYAGLGPLIRDMSKLLIPDYHFARHPIQQHPEYIHDSLQPIILNFLLENKNAEFLGVEAASEMRVCEGSFISSSSLSVEERRTKSISTKSSCTHKRKHSPTNSTGSESSLSVSEPAGLARENDLSPVAAVNGSDVKSTADNLSVRPKRPRLH